jgi:L-threonylcarbamoyladenylate synthase
MHVSPTQGEHVASSLGGAPDLILDAGPVSVGIESTVVDLSAGVPTILRPGMISIEDLRAVLGRVESATSAVEGAARPSPGMMDRHDSPTAELLVVEATEMARAISDRRADERVVVLGRSIPAAPHATLWQMPQAPADYARVLYGMLHQADAQRFEVVIVEAVPASAAWDGVRDRLRRAAG